MAKLLNLFLVLVFVVAMSIEGTQAACGDGLKDLIKECQQYVMPPKDPKIPPSDGCCGLVKKVDVPCLCSKVTKAIEAIVSMEKVAFVAEKCGRPLEHGYKCGSYTVPAK
ncbi:hypothetical protein SEVIR_5G354800v4 [Setaria viridis]|uniref:Bifunctional inhibitor/plant lipid transfer protein/seed storage helical domain-containing protein n=2 Tax=Setaria TaxID=4554 RepID=Q7XBG4_SETIT|nr:uncharacterized protein LOC101756926 precursor [Setaria italica]XP_034593197.1 protein LIM1-like [Setaria viridis]AAP93138.1 unknown [Setaria italica]RCV27749.1 hypothetical protein SETIT_5G350000v2 [Setaria italica]TKW17262.1 hypothetical protein SEVIR_5G354800v2 [Setaria viridis]